MTKNDKLSYLINGIIMLNQTSEHRNHDIYKLAEEIGFLINGNPRFAVLSCIGASYEETRNAVKQVLKEEKILDLE